MKDLLAVIGDVVAITFAEIVCQFKGHVLTKMAGYSYCLRCGKLETKEK